MNHQISSYNLKLASVIYVAVFLLIAATAIYHTKGSGILGARRAAAQSHFDNMNLSAKAVYVYDVEAEKMLYGRNEHVPLPLASITKLMTAVCALDILDKDTVVMVPSSRLGNYGDKDLGEGDIWKISDLVSYMLIKSSNDAAVTLSEAVGGSERMISCMNIKAEEVGLFETKFYNVTGLDMESSDTEATLAPGAYGSAEDAAKLLQYGMRRYPEIFGITRYQSYNVEALDGSVQVATNTNRVQSQIVGMEASKTGLTDLAGGNLVFEMNVGLSHRVVIAVLGSTEEGRFEDALALSLSVINYLGRI